MGKVNHTSTLIHLHNMSVALDRNLNSTDAVLTPTL